MSDTELQPPTQAAAQLLPRVICANQPRLHLRPVQCADMDFLRQLYATTRAAELAQVDWTDQQKRQFVDFQFHAQHTYYGEHFPDASRDIVVVDGVDAGRLYLDLRATEIRLIDIALLPEHCGRGTGGILLRQLLQVAEDRRLPVSIHVEQNNPALRLYQRLGFLPVEEQGVYFLMRWSPSAHETKD